jgi:enamine deaminase RidA (YjgF/YER057c/UK114 family)
LAEVPAGHRLVFISGQVGNTVGGNVAGGGIAEQTRQALANIEALLNAAGATPANLVRLQSFMVSADSIPGFRQELVAAYTRWFAGTEQGYPGHTLLVVQALASPALLVEIEGWFTLPPPDEPRQGA